MANKRQTIIDAIKTRFEAISSIETVAVWRVTDLAPTELPAILLRDTVDNMPSDGTGPSRRDHDLTVEITVLFSGSTSASDARELAADIVAAIGTDPNWSDNAFDTVLDSIELDLESANQLVAIAQINITVRYRSELWSI